MTPIIPEILDVTADCQIVSARIVNAPIETVFKAWTTPRHLEKWWGPAGFTNTFKVFDLRPGGTWSFIMHGPDKGNYVNECVFIKIEKPVLIAWHRLTNPLFQVVASFEEVRADKTRVMFKMLFETAAECDKVRALATEKNEENFDRLEAELQEIAKKT
jgi:uncharacterized protein YndB with AHSA1/START domain